MRRVNYFLNIQTPPSAMTWPRVDPARIAIRPPSPPPCVFIPVKIGERDTSRATFISTSPNGYMWRCEQQQQLVWCAGLDQLAFVYNRIGYVGDGIFSCFELWMVFGVCHASGGGGVILHLIPLGRLMIWVLPLHLYQPALYSPSILFSKWKVNQIPWCVAFLSRDISFEKSKARSRARVNQNGCVLCAAMELYTTDYIHPRFHLPRPGWWGTGGTAYLLSTLRLFLF